MQCLRVRLRRCAAEAEGRGLDGGRGEGGAAPLQGHSVVVHLGQRGLKEQSGIGLLIGIRLFGGLPCHLDDSLTSSPPSYKVNFVSKLPR